MKKVTVLLSTLTTILLTANVQASEVQFDILGVNSDAGKIYVQLFKGEENYKQGKAETASIIKAKSGEVKVLFNDIGQGEYAVRFFHDENDNGKLETNLFGMPTEGYGFSNNAKANFGPAKYSEMKFVVPADAKKVTNQSTVTY